MTTKYILFILLILSSCNNTQYSTPVFASVNVIEVRGKSLFLELNVNLENNKELQISNYEQIINSITTDQLINKVFFIDDIEKYIDGGLLSHESDYTALVISVNERDSKIQGIEMYNSNLKKVVFF